MPGRPLGLIGHGLRARQVRGPAVYDRPPVLLVVLTRRFLCLACGAALNVTPRGLLRYKHHAASAIGLALALFGLERLAIREVRARVSPWRHAEPFGWLSLRRWLRSVRRGELFSGLPPCPPGWPPRRVAERAATWLAAWAEPALSGLPLWAQAFFGASALPDAHRPGPRLAGAAHHSGAARPGPRP